MERDRPPSTWDSWKKPPTIKVLEALGCIADGRIKISNSTATVTSSDGSRTYLVRMVGNAVCSTDNGTKFKGYIGYPIIAFLMLKGLLPFDEEIASHLRGIPWKRLNETYKRYWIVENIIYKQLESSGIPKERVKSFIKNIIDKLGQLGLGRLDDEVCSG